MKKILSLFIITCLFVDSSLLAHASKQPVVYLILDIHGHTQAQTSISQMIQDHIEEKKIDVVALEGAFGPLDIATLKEFPDPTVNRPVADFLLQKQILAGPLHAALTTENNTVPFVGVDDETLYNQHVHVLRNALAHQPFVQRPLQPLHQSLVNLTLRPDQWNVIRRHPGESRGPGALDSGFRRNDGMFFPFKQFYSLAQKRDTAMAKNLLRYMKEQNATTALLVAGGFHAPGVRHHLEKKGLKVHSVLPYVTSLDNHDPHTTLRSVATQNTLVKRVLTSDIISTFTTLRVRYAENPRPRTLQINRKMGSNLLSIGVLSLALLYDWTQGNGAGPVSITGATVTPFFLSTPDIQGYIDQYIRDEAKTVAQLNGLQAWSNALTEDVRFHGAIEPSIFDKARQSFSKDTPYLLGVTGLWGSIKTTGARFYAQAFSQDSTLREKGLKRVIISHGDDFRGDNVPVEALPKSIREKFQKVQALYRKRQETLDYLRKRNVWYKQGLDYETEEEYVEQLTKKAKRQRERLNKAYRKYKKGLRENGFRIHHLDTGTSGRELEGVFDIARYGQYILAMKDPEASDEYSPFHPIADSRTRETHRITLSPEGTIHYLFGYSSPYYAEITHRDNRARLVFRKRGVADPIPEKEMRENTEFFDRDIDLSPHVSVDSRGGRHFRLEFGKNVQFEESTYLDLFLDPEGKKLTISYPNHNTKDRGYAFQLGVKASRYIPPVYQVREFSFLPQWGNRLIQSIIGLINLLIRSLPERVSISASLLLTKISESVIEGIYFSFGPFLRRFLPQPELRFSQQEYETLPRQVLLRNDFEPGTLYITESLLLLFLHDAKDQSGEIVDERLKYHSNKSKGLFDDMVAFRAIFPIRMNRVIVRSKDEEKARDIVTSTQVRNVAETRIGQRMIYEDPRFLPRMEDARLNLTTHSLPEEVYRLFSDAILLQPNYVGILQQALGVDAHELNQMLLHHLTNQIKEKIRQNGFRLDHFATSPDGTIAAAVSDQLLIKFRDQGTHVGIDTKFEDDFKAYFRPSFGQYFASSSFVGLDDMEVTYVDEQRAQRKVKLGRVLIQVKWRTAREFLEDIRVEAQKAQEYGDSELMKDHDEKARDVIKKLFLLYKTTAELGHPYGHPERILNVTEVAPVDRQELVRFTAVGHLKTGDPLNNKLERGYLYRPNALLDALDSVPGRYRRMYGEEWANIFTDTDLGEAYDWKSRPISHAMDWDVSRQTFQRLEKYFAHARLEQLKDFVLKLIERRDISPQSARERVLIWSHFVKEIIPFRGAKVHQAIESIMSDLSRRSTNETTGGDVASLFNRVVNEQVKVVPLLKDNSTLDGATFRHFVTISRSYFLDAPTPRKKPKASIEQVGLILLALPLMGTVGGDLLSTGRINRNRPTHPLRRIYSAA